MGSHDSDPIDETVLLSEAPKEATQSSPTDQCRSLASLVSFSSSKAEIESDVHFYPIHKLMLVSEAPKLEEESFCAEDCVSLFTEYPALESGSDLLHQHKETVEESVDKQQSCMETTDSFSYDDDSFNLDSVSDICCEAEFENKDIAAGLCGMESDTKDDCCPESGMSSEVEYGVSRMCLNNINIKNDRISSGLKPIASSLEYLQFSGHDCSINTLDESQMASEKLSVFGGARILEEGRVLFPNDIANLSALRSTKSVMDLSDVVTGLHVHIPSSPVNAVSESFTNCHEKTNSDHVDVPLAASNLEGSDMQHGVLNDQHFISYVLEHSTMPSEHVGNLASSAKQAHSLQPCVSDIVLGNGSHSDLFGQEAFKLNGVLHGIRSVATADASCFADEGQEKAQTGVHLTDSAEASLRRSSRANKFIQKAPNIIYSRKGSKKGLGRVIDLLPAAVRSRRSFLNRSARLSKWGLFDTLSKYIAMDTLVEQGSGSVKSGNKIRKKDMVQVGGGSDGSYARSRTSSGQVRLKLKIVNKSKSNIEPNPIVGIDTQVVHLTGNGDNQLDLRNSLKDVSQQASKKSQESFADMKMYGSATSHENPRVAVDPVNKDLGATRMSDKYNKGINAGRSFLDKDVEKSGVSADDRHLNSGTSPDSEVIQVPESQFPSEMVHHDDDMDSSKTTLTPAENAIPAVSKTRRKKGNKKEKICQLVGSDVQNVLGSSIIYRSGLAEKYCDKGPISDMATRCDAGHESADSRNSKKLLPPAKAEGNRKFKSKLKASSTPRLDMCKSSGVKGDKWKLAGKHVMNDSDGKEVSIPTSGVASEDVSGLLGTSSSTVLQIAVAQPRSAWVCCDDCLKWRCIPSNLADIIDETDCRWTCKDNQDKAFADCSVPQEKSNAEINAELNISEAEEGHHVQLNGGPKQSQWMLIKSNIFLHRRRKTQTLDEIMVCHCKLKRDGKVGCGDECLNRMLNIECVQGTCPCGDLCANQQFQRQSYANLMLFRCGKKGFGLQVIDNVTQGQFLIEYVGEVLELSNYESRLREYSSKGHPHFYFMTLNGNEVIDACAKGHLGRFINHSCDPNCRTEKWMVNGEICIGIFAVRDIKKGEELTFDYNYVRVFGAAAKKCHCGSAQCRGYIGGDRLNNETIVQGDSDEEFPEPVAVYENGELAHEYNIVSKSCCPDVLEEENEDTLLQNDIRITLDDKDIIDKLEISEKDDLHDPAVGDSQIDNSLEIVRHMQQAENADKTTLDVQQEKQVSRISECSVSPKTSHNWSLNRLHPESLSEYVDTRFDRSSAEMVCGEPVHLKGRPRMKISRPLKSVKSKESSDSSATIGRPLLTPNKSQLMSNKLKKLVESSTKHRSETVEDKLNELLNKVGGICKQKDAFKGYLKLLVLTAASGDSSHHETIQSNKDLSMILDAILKTKSRTVLTDILNKNGLQMLHSLMKKCRGNFNKIPILRKLLKVFEFLAERKILTLEHINGELPRPGVESFRDSMLSLTEYHDRKVHQIARNFRDNWIPRSGKKLKCMDKGERNIDFKGAPNYQRFDQLERSLESIKCVKQSVPSNHPLDSDSFARSRRSCKRKSRWDQPAEPSLPLKIDSCNEVDEARVMEDGPPGFSCPSFKGPPLSKQYPGPLECPNEMPSGFPQERFNSAMPTGYGISLNMVQEFGTPQASTGGGWVIAPGVPFCPFPPLPSYPNPQPNIDVQSGLPNMIPNVRGPYRPQRRYFKQRQRNFRNYSTTPSGVVMRSAANSQNEHPGNVNYGVEFAGN